MIKYHQNGIQPEYGEDHQLTNNWNPDGNYNNEYANVYFRIEAHKYQYPSFSFTEDDHLAFYGEVKAALQPLGWNMKDNSDRWYCGDIVKGKQTLYLHPQDFSGEVLKNEIKQISEALEKHEAFNLRWVDLYDTVYDITDGEYEKFLSTKDDEIRTLIFEKCQTKRTNQYFQTFDVCRRIANKVRLRRLGLNDGRNGSGGQTLDYIQKHIESMINEKLLMSTVIDDCMYVRSANKTEQKKFKLKVA
ncbi:MAG: hypothetical protein RSF40_01470 [Oscillospiraceae bacterium]